MRKLISRTRILSSHYRSWGAFVLFQALTFALYGNSLNGQFLYDDLIFSAYPGFRRASALWSVWVSPFTSPTQYAPAYRPLSSFSFVANFLIFGESTFAFHLVNVILNGIVCWLVFLFVERLWSDRTLALVTALLFAFMPVHTDAVSYIKSRDEILMTLFLLLGWLAFFRGLEKPGKAWRWIIVSAFCTFAAAASKEYGIVAPVLYFYVAFVQKRVRLRTMLRWSIPFVAAMIAFVAVRSVAVGILLPPEENLYFGINPLGYFSYAYAFWTAFEIAFLSVAKSIVPWNLSATYSYHHLPIVNSLTGSWMVGAGIATLTILLFLVVWKKTRGTPLGIGSAVFLALYFPFSKFLFVKHLDIFAEHWLYATSIAIALMMAYGITRFHRTVVVVVLVLVLGIYASILVPRNFVWRSEETLAESMVRDAPDGVHGYVMLAKIRLTQGRTIEAEDLLNKALDITVLNPPVFQLLAVLQMGNGDFFHAEQSILEAERLHPDLTDQQLRALLLAKAHRFEESLDILERSKQYFAGGDGRERMVLAIDLYRLGRKQEAEQYFDWDAVSQTPLTREQKIFFIENF